MKTICTAAIAAVMIVAATGASAATMTFEATVNNVSGSTGLLTELFGTSTDRTLKLRATFDTDVSSGAIVQTGSNSLVSSYDAFSIIAPATTINAVASGSGAHRVFTRDGDTSSNDLFQVGSFPLSADPASYYSMYVQAVDNDLTTWSRSTPISASLLNSFSTQNFSFSKGVLVNGSSQRQLVSSNSVTWVEISAVPLPAGLPLLLAGLGALGIAGRRRRS